MIQKYILFVSVLLACLCVTCAGSGGVMEKAIQEMNRAFQQTYEHLLPVQPHAKFTRQTEASCVGGLNTIGLNGACSPDTDLCQSNLQCANDTKTCRISSFGQACSTSDDCYGASGFDCINNECDVQRSSGDACTSNAQCLSGACIGSTCSKRDLGANCTGSDCSSSAYCSAITNTCVSRLAVGSSCSNELLAIATAGSPNRTADIVNVCAGGSICDLISGATVHGNCVALSSLQDGSPAGIFGTATCAENTYYNGSNCVKNLPCYSFLDCVTASVYGIGVECTCGSDTSQPGVCGSSTDICDLTDLIKCGSNYGTLVNQQSVYISGTTAANCYNEVVTFTCCLLTATPGLTYVIPPMTCPGSSSNAVTAVASASLISAAAAVAFLV